MSIRTHDHVHAHDRVHDHAHDHRPEPRLAPSRQGTVVLDIGDGIGALVVHTPPELCGIGIEITRRGERNAFVHTEVRERVLPEGSVYTGVFVALDEGDYTLLDVESHPTHDVSIASGPRHRDLAALTATCAPRARRRPGPSARRPRNARPAIAMTSITSEPWTSGPVPVVHSKSVAESVSPATRFFPPTGPPEPL